MPLLLEVWREVCRHIEIEQSLERTAPILLASLPLDAIAVRRIDLARASVETPATVRCQPGAASGSARSELSALCRAVGVLQPRDSVELHNIPLLLTVKLKKREDTGELTNEVKGYEPKASAGQAPQAPVASNTPPWKR